MQGICIFHEIEKHIASKTNHLKLIPYQIPQPHPYPPVPVECLLLPVGACRPWNCSRFKRLAAQFVATR